MADGQFHELDESTLPLGLRRASSTIADINLLDDYDRSSETLRDSPEPFTADDDEEDYGVAFPTSDSLHSYESRDGHTPPGYPHNLLNANDGGESAYRVTPDLPPSNHHRTTLLPFAHLHPWTSPSPSAANRNSQQTIDLTSDSPDSDSDIMPPRRSRKRTVAQREGTAASASAGPSTKRTKTTPTKKDRESQESEKPVEAIDLVEDTPLAEALQKQRAEQVKAQQEPTEKPLRLSNLSCVICMDHPEDLTATSCGHVFCHTCLMEALIAGEKNHSHLGAAGRHSQCPVCRKALNRQKVGEKGDLIPLLLKKGLATQLTKKKAAAA